MTEGEQPGYGGPPHHARQPRTEGLAVAALVVALLSFLAPVGPAIVALVLAAMAARRIREAPEGSLGGGRLVTAARVVAVIGLVWVALAVLGVVLILLEGDRAGGAMVAGSALLSSREEPA